MEGDEIKRTTSKHTNRYARETRESSKHPSCEKASVDIKNIKFLRKKEIRIEGVDFMLQARRKKKKEKGKMSSF